MKRLLKVAAAGSAARKLSLWLLGVALVFASTPADAITFGQVDDFAADNVANWGPDPTRISNDGPAGAGDAYLQYTSTGTGGPSSKLQIRNDIQWTGNYVSEGVTAISLFARNEGSATINLRLAIGNPTDVSQGSNPANSGTWYNSSGSVDLAPGSGWTPITLALTSAALQQGLGSDSLETVLASVTQLRILSNNFASNRGVSDPGVFGVDDIAAVPEPGTAVLLGIGLAGLAALRRREHDA